MYYTQTIPAELTSFKKNDLIEEDEDFYFQPAVNIEINKDSRGRISVLNYYSQDGNLQKQIFYKGELISGINYYRKNNLTIREEYEKELLLYKYIYNKDGNLNYLVQFEYNDKNYITKISKESKNKKIVVKYDYDSLDRIIGRSIIVNEERVFHQSYNYDILDRVIEYKDENQHIIVNSISKKNELLSYTITDKIGNVISVTNFFTEENYVETKFTLNEHSITLKDTSYVDNIMLKKPHTNEDDLDLIIANLFRAVRQKSDRTSYNKVLQKNSMSLIDNSIETKVLPISIRKRILYNIAVNSNC